MRWAGPFLFCIACFAQPSPDGVAYFENNIRPLLVANCSPCHRDLRVHLVVPGKPDESLLITAVRQTTNLKMPPGKTLQPAEVEALVEWVKMGAPLPVAAVASTKPHWAFQPVRDPGADRTIDGFLKSKLARAGKVTLLRRATYDLIGLPPRPEEIDAFVQDKSPQAFEKVVDRLLASPQYGERWGRHWLDVVRYADTAGDNADFPVPSLYRYRNWVIDAFNRDEPYDQFVREQIAGDLLQPPNVVATGYLANSRRFGSRANEFHLTIDDTIDNLGKGILGISIGCARCHDHKFDPIPTSDYYALYGIFKSTNYAHPGTEIYPHTYGFAALNAEDTAKLKDVESKLSGLDNHIEDIKAGKIKFASDAEKRKAEQDDQATLRRLSAEYPKIAKAYAVSEGKSADARIMVRGEPQTLGPSVPRGFLKILGGQKLPPEEKGSGRLELAGWITDPKNPLTARVIVNRVWAWHFGQGIVRSPDDFGTRGEAPRYPELLDYLTARFIEDGWSIKKLHRRIMLTRTYQTVGGGEFLPRRLDAEEFRDSLLLLAGTLDLTPGGEHPFPPEMSWRYTQHNPFLGAENAYATKKRSVYLMQQRIRRQPFLDLFDGPDPNAETGVRPLTTTALQALYTMNDPFFHEQADALALRVGMGLGSDAERLGYAYKLLYGRAPSSGEVADARKFLMTARKAVSEPREAWASQMRVLLATNEFLYVE